MKLIAICEPGGPDVLAMREAPVPGLGASEVLIKVAAAGVNRADLLQRRGHYPPPPGAPEHPGLEVAGVVEALGESVTRFSVGDRVCALLAGGGYAQFCAVHEGQVLPIPAGMPMVEAACLPEACFTVWTNLMHFGRLARGESVLIHGGSSGIGVIAIQMAVALGHKVFATAGSAAKCAACERLGARAINYNEQDFVSEVRAQSARGVDVILDMVGGIYLSRNLHVLADEGRLVLIATQRGTTAELDLLQLMRRRLVITGSTLRARAVEFKTQMRDQLESLIWPHIASGRVRPVLDRVFPWTQAGAAHEYMERGQHIGKIVLEVDAMLGA